MIEGERERIMHILAYHNFNIITDFHILLLGFVK